MRIVRWGAFVTWLIVAGLAVAGFAAFSPRPVTSVVVDPSSSHSFADGRGSATGRVLAVAFAIGTRSTDVTIVGSDPAVGRRDPDADQPLAATAIGMPPAQSAPLTPATTESAPTTLVAGPTVPVDEYQWPNGSACQASWYGPGLEGSPTASGEPFDPEQLTGAIHDVPFGTLVRVSRADTGASIMVRINDRGPFIWDDGWRRHPARCIDLSPAAMRAIDDTGDGVIDVTINY